MNNRFHKSILPVHKVRNQLPLSQKHQTILKIQNPLNIVDMRRKNVSKYGQLLHDNTTTIITKSTHPTLEELVVTLKEVLPTQRLTISKLTFPTTSPPPEDSCTPPNPDAQTTSCIRGLGREWEEEDSSKDTSSPFALVSSL